MKGASLFDLLKADQSVYTTHCDVCVIGAGAAGVYLGVRLASKGLDVVLVEAGSSICGEASEVGFEAQFLDQLYPGATQGRAFGLGGSTSRWGGLLAPHTHRDLRETADADRSPWSHIVQTVSAKADNVLKVLGCRKSVEFTRFAREQLGCATKALDASGLDVTACLFLPFRYKNLVFLLEKKSASRSRLRVFINAVAKSWAIKSGANSSARVQCLTAVTRNGNSVDVTAKHFVIAAGAIESARILLELNSFSSDRVLPPTAAVGRYLSDHLSVSIADVAGSSMDEAARLFAPRFSGGWMRGFRFIESESPAGAPRAFAHFIFENKNSGFLLAKEVLGAIQGRRWPQVSYVEAVSGVSGLVALAYARYIHSSLHIPSGTRTCLQLDIEQTPSRENRISLGVERDRYGRHVAEIRWRINDIDLGNIHATATRILEKWPGTKAHLPELVPKNLSCDSTKPHDAYHPVGTCRLGVDEEAVVDPTLRVKGTENLWVLNTGVLPSAGTANPTFTMLCLGEDLSDHLVSTVCQQTM